MVSQHTFDKIIQTAVDLLQKGVVGWVLTKK
jgi:hypothetical protein